MLRLAINGYGRIGRLAHRVILKKYSEQIKVVAINGTTGTDLKGWALLLKYDTVYGPLTDHEISFKSEELINQELFQHPPSSANPEDIVPDEHQRLHQTIKLGHLLIDGQEIPFFAEKDPRDLPWKALKVDVVIESSGIFVSEELARPHLQAGAKCVLISAPSKGGQVKTLVLGVNAHLEAREKLDRENSPPAGEAGSLAIFSAASCTTNSITPVAAVIEQNFGLKRAMMTTIHGYTSDQRLQDGSHKDYRRARAAALNIIPTFTGATLAAAEALPELKDIFNGLAFRVPVPVGSVADFTILTKKKTSVEEVNLAFVEAAQNPLYQNILEVTRDPLVSSDVIGNPHSAIVDCSLTQVLGGDLVKVVAWYDNEWGYCHRLIETALVLGRNLTETR